MGWTKEFYDGGISLSVLWMSDSDHALHGGGHVGVASGGASNSEMVQRSRI